MLCGSDPPTMAATVKAGPSGAASRRIPNSLGALLQPDPIGKGGPGGFAAGINPAMRVIASR